MTKNFANPAFNALFQVADDRANELERFGQTQVLDSSDDEIDSVRPIYDGFFSNVQTNGILKMTNSSPMELEKLHKRFEPIVRPARTSGGGKKSQYTTFDTLYGAYSF